MKHRWFIDHKGRVHRVRMNEEEIRERWAYLAGFVGTCLLFGIVVTIASGIL